MTKKKVYKLLATYKYGLVFFWWLCNYSIYAQSSTQSFTDEPIYNLEEALQQNPLKVYSLSLKKMKLPQLPKDIDRFKNLRYLDLSRNKLNQFPYQLVQFKQLQYLDLSLNEILVIPKEIGLLTNLTQLYLNQNKLTTLPVEVRNLKKLKAVNLFGNAIKLLPHEISELKDNLEKLDIRLSLLSKEEYKIIKALLPETKIRFSKSCNCGF